MQSSSARTPGAPRSSPASPSAACLNIKIGERERALDLLEKAIGLGGGKRGWIERDPDHDPLRVDPRFRALMARLK